MADLQGFDFNPDAVADRPAKVLLPVGDYIVEITDSDFKATKNGLGKYISFEFTVIDGEYVGRKFFENLNVMNNNEKTVEIANRALKDLLRATNTLGKPFTNTTMLHNIPLKVRATMGKRSDNGEDENRFRFSAVNEVASSDPPAPAAKTQAPATGGNAPKKKPWEK
jgi:hypothetical protein